MNAPTRMVCHLCQCWLQPLSPSSTWVPDAIQHAAANRVDLPAPGPAALVWLALIAHQRVVHPSSKLHDYLEAYLSQ